MEEWRGTEERLRGGCYWGGEAKRRWEAEADGWSYGAVRGDRDKVIRSAYGELAMARLLGSGGWGIKHIQSRWAQPLEPFPSIFQCNSLLGCAFVF
jgi:hypothetical protein